MWYDVPYSVSQNKNPRSRFDKRGKYEPISTIFFRCCKFAIRNERRKKLLKRLVEKSTRSSASHLLSVPRHNLSSGSRAFRISAPKIPPHILQSRTFDSFRRHFKDLLLSVGLSRPLAPIPNATWFSSETLALYKSLTYLLAYYIMRHLTSNLLTHSVQLSVGRYMNDDTLCNEN